MFSRPFFVVASGILLGAALWFFNIPQWFFPFQERLFAISKFSKPSPCPDIPSLLAAKIKILEEENKKLKDGLSLKNVYPNTKTALVIGQELKSRTRFLIGKGEKEGVEKGAAVLSPGALVGKIIGTKEHSASVALIIDPVSKFSGAILRPSAPISGVIESVHSLGVRFSLIPLEQELKSGEEVVTGGQEIGVPRGIPVGVIEEIEETPGAPLKQATITPFVDFNQLTLVTVLSLGI